MKIEFILLLSSVVTGIYDETRSIKKLLETKDLQNRYIVVLKQDSRSVNSNILDRHLKNVRSLMQANGNTTFVSTNNTKAIADANKSTYLRHVYRSALQGYSGTFSSDMIEKVKSMPEVELVEMDSISTTQGFLIQKNVPWGLSRISQKDKLDTTKALNYIFDGSSSGQDVTAYVIDTGIDVLHREFEGRARWGKSFVNSGPDDDDNGHGTHVAGTIGSRSFGVAKKVELVAVKVLDSQGSGYNSDIIAGIEWAVADSKKNGKSKGSVANMSLGGSYSKAINVAVDKAVASGIAFAVAAGNENEDACKGSPSSSKSVLCVAASTDEDLRASFSNFGSCVSLFAPGQNIKSTWIGASHQEVKSISGTSMATPHIVGLMAYFRSVSSAKLNPSEVYNLVLKSATHDKIDYEDGETPNLLSYNLGDNLVSLPLL